MINFHTDLQIGIEKVDDQSAYVQVFGIMSVTGIGFFFTFPR